MSTVLLFLNGEVQPGGIKADKSGCIVLLYLWASDTCFKETPIKKKKHKLFVELDGCLGPMPMNVKMSDTILADMYILEKRGSALAISRSVRKCPSYTQRN